MVDDPAQKAAAALAKVVQAQMQGADRRSVEVVTAITVLLARVAFADRRYDRAEAARVREELSMVLGFGEPEVDAVCSLLESKLEELAQSELDPYTEPLRQHFDVHMRADTVKVLIELAAADREIADTEVRVIREVAAKLLVDDALLEALLLRAEQLNR